MQDHICQKFTVPYQCRHVLLNSWSIPGKPTIDLEHRVVSLSKGHHLARPRFLFSHGALRPYKRLFLLWAHRHTRHRILLATHTGNEKELTGL